MILFICFIVGLVICIKKLRKEPPTQLTREQRMSPYERMLQEKRLGKMQGIQEQRIIQPQEHTVYNNRSIAVVEHEPIQPRHNGHSYSCYSQPVRIFKPEAMYFMPK